jgi:hypothetical protein
MDGKALNENCRLFLSFPYVCPEPVLVKCSFLYINGSKSRTGNADAKVLALGADSVESRPRETALACKTTERVRFISKIVLMLVPSLSWQRISVQT